MLIDLLFGMFLGVVIVAMVWMGYFIMIASINDD